MPAASDPPPVRTTTGLLLAVVPRSSPLAADPVAAGAAAVVLLDGAEARRAGVAGTPVVRLDAADGAVDVLTAAGVAATAVPGRPGAALVAVEDADRAAAVLLAAVAPRPGGVRIRAVVDADAGAVIGLWRAAGLTRPWNDPQADFRRKRAVQPDLFLIAEQGADAAGTVMAGYDGHRGWLYYLAVDPARRGAGVGRLLVRHAERALAALGCPKVQLQVRVENDAVLGFYAAVGYEPYEVLDLGRRLVHDG